MNSSLQAGVSIGNWMDEAGQMFMELDSRYHVVFCTHAVRERFPVTEGDTCYQRLTKGRNVCTGCPVNRVFQDRIKAHSMVRCRNGSGENVWLSSTAMPVCDGSGNVIRVQVLMQDVTSGVRPGQSEDRRDRLFSRLVDQLPDVVFSLDSRSVFGFVNRSAGELFDCETNKILGTSLGDHVAPEDKALAGTLLNMGPNAVWDHQMTVLDANGREKFVRIRCKARFDAQNELVGFDGILRDRTLQRKLEQAVQKYQVSLRDSEKRYRTLVENIPDVIFSLDQDGRFSFINQEVEPLLGWSVPDLLDKYLWEVAAPEYRSVAESVLSAQPDGVWDEELAVTGVNGETKWVRIRCKAVVDSDSRVIGFEGVLRDRTSQKTLEENLNAARKELMSKIRIIDDLYEHIVQTERYKAITRHTAEVAHELRQPLAIIGGFARRMLKKLESCDKVDPDSQQDCFTIISKEVNRLENILEGLVDFTKHREIQLECVDPHELIEEVIHVNEERLREGEIDTQIDFGQELDEVPLDPERFGHVFRNLLTNAIEATPRRGSILVKTGAFIPSEKAQQTGDLQSDTYFEMRISNTGDPIPEEELGQIFDPFFTTKPHGTGLGLALSKRMVEEHRGSISVQSNEDGTTVSVWIPVDPLQKQEC